MSFLATLSDLLKGGPKNIKRRLLRDILLILFMVSGSIFAIVLIQGIRTQHDISTAIISEANRNVAKHFHSYTEPLNNLMRLLAKWGEAGLLQLDDPELLATQFQALMEIHPNVKAISLTDTETNEIQLSHDGDQWILRRHQQQQTTLSQWVNGEIVSHRKTDNHYNPAETTWYRGAMGLSSDKEFFLTEPHLLDPMEERGITASLRWMKKNNPGRFFISAISFTLKDLVSFMGQLEITENSHILLLQKNATLLRNLKVNLPHHDAAPKSNTHPLSSQLLDTVVEKLETNTPVVNQSISLKVAGQSWWLGLSPLYGTTNNVWVGVLIPGDDIFVDLQKQWLRFSILVGSILLTGIVLTLLLVRKYSHQLKDLPQQHLDSIGYKNEIMALIKAGESATLEFKSTMRMNLRTGKAGKEIELAWLKGVAAFMNSDGGILLIGVDDEGKIVGTEADNFDNEDKCRLHFKNLLNAHIGAEFTRYIHLKIVTVQEKTILIVECERVRRPVFLSVGKNEDFFIRSGPSNTKLSMSQMVKYLAER